jgi:hypothetical protein
MDSIYCILYTTSKIQCGKTKVEVYKLLTENIEDLLQDMHIGECKRDAAPGVRGFLFQDLLAIEELIRTDTEYICSEFIEDVCTVTSNGIRILQCKYTPKTDLKIKEITRELYYQYIKLRQFGYSENITPVLRYHADTPTVPDENTSKLYLELKPDQKPFKGNAAERKEKAYECINLSNKKTREDSLFANFYETANMKKFLCEFKLEEVKISIGAYRKLLGEKLDGLIDADACPIEDDEERQSLLISLATKLIHEHYNEETVPDNNQELLKHRILRKKDFIETLEKLFAIELPFSGVIENYVDETYFELDDELLTSEKRICLDNLYISTKEWVKSNMISKAHVVKLLNTVSTNKTTPCVIDSNQVLREALYICKERIMTFYKNIWKVKLNLSQDTFEECLITGIHEYLAFSFQKQQDWSTQSIIMGSIGDCPQKKLQYLLMRIRSWRERPQKWYLRSHNTRGIGDYSMDVAQITSEKLDVTTISPDRFAVECMGCIGIDQGEWSNNEICEGNIFSINCKHGGII